MITRPLELASRLRPEPRNVDWLFFVNAGLLVLFFSLFGSRFVLAPGLKVNLPQMPGARAGGAHADRHITVTGPGLIFVKSGPVTPEELKTWLVEEEKIWRAENGRRNRGPTLLVLASDNVPNGTLVEIATAAAAAGFNMNLAADEPAAERGGR